MILTFQQIKCICEDIRCNPNNTKEIVDFKLRAIEGMCINSIIRLNEIRNGNN